MSAFGELIVELKQKLYPILNISFTFNAKKEYAFKVWHVLCVLIFLFLFGFFAGFFAGKFELSKQIFSAPVFASIFGALILSYGYIKGQGKLEILKISEKKLEILSLLSNAKMIFTQEIEKIAIEITKYFGLNSIYALHSFLIALKLETDEKKAYQELLLQMNGEIFKLQKKNDILKYKINGKPLLQAIYWLFSASKENVLKHLVLNSKIFISETDTIPGIFCRLRDELSAIKIYDTKRREASKPLAIYSVNPMHYLASNPIITLLLESLPDISMTIVAKANGNTPAFVVKNKFVGVRILSTQSKFYQFLRENNLTLLGTSANFSNQQSPSSLDDLEKDFIQNIPILKLNEKASTLHSSVLKIENEKIVILREGAYFESILNWIKQHNSQQVQAFEDGIEKKAYIINLNNNLQNNEK